MGAVIVLARGHSSFDAACYGSFYRVGMRPHRSFESES